ncbi:MAG: 1-deoxy-D-xylulose-5-phosphate synthase [Erysipelotrichaceae bacterium]|nr:1-deoxy-D-xylulose-5-phosphate synthase [Erysipelotrichaceae bacterium]
MDITSIKDPSFLKGMTVEELQKTADEIRSFLIDSVSRTGGHLSSNLGVVELTIALHYVFDTPNDRVFFDVGHQCYTHKILTGRADRFATLRKYQGLSGFQKRHESPYDCFEAGHSSTSLSAALGMAVARDLKHEHYEIVPVIGDGALLSGMSMEALNQIGYEKRKVIIIFNDNAMSISGNVGALSRSLARLRNSRGYNNLKGDVKKALRNRKYGEAVINGIHNFKDTIKKTVIDSGIFKELNLEYYGPVDGHNLKDLIRVMEVAKENDEPCVIHVVTKKGKGYLPAENDNSGFWHGVGPFNKETGKLLRNTPEGFASTSAIAAGKIEELMGEDQRITALTPAMRQGSALNSIFAHYPDRSFDCGIAEEHAMTFAAGIALNGCRPFLSIYSTFLQRAYDQLNHDVCRMDLPVVLGIDRAGLVGADGETHHGIYDIGMLRPLPNLILAEGKDAQEMRDLLDLAFSQPHPFALRYPRCDLPLPENNEKHPIEVGKWKILGKNDTEVKATILAFGPDCLKIAELVAANDLPYRVVNCRFLKPFDTELLKELLNEGKPLFVYEPEMCCGGFGEGVAAFAAEQGKGELVDVSAIPDRYVPQGSVAQLLEELQLDLPSFMARIEKVLHDQ